MAQYREGNTFTIKNPGGGNISFTAPEGQLFKLADGTPAVFKNNQLSLYTGKESLGNLPTLSNENLLSFTQDRFEGGITKVDNPDTTFFKQFQVGSNLSPGSYTPFGGFGAPVSQLTPAQIAPYEQAAGMTTTQQSAEQRLGGFQAAGAPAIPTTPQKQPNPDNPFFGIPPAISSQMTSLADAQSYWAGTYQPSTTPPAAGTTVSDKKATLTSPDGSQKTVVQVGSEQASRLLNSGWTLGTSQTATFIDASLLEDLTEIDLSGIDKDKYSYPNEETTIAGANETIKQAEAYMALFDRETDSSKKESQLSDELFNLFGDLGGREAFYQDQLKQAGVEQLKKDLNTIIGNIRLKSAGLEKELADIASTPQTLARMRGAQAAARRVTQADILFDQARAQFLMDDINLGLELAKAATDAKYNPILESIDIKQQQLDIVSRIADKEQDKWISALNYTLAQEKQQVADAKALEDSLNNVLADYINAGGKDTNVMSKIRNSKTEADALQILGTNIPGSTTKPTWGVIGQDEFGNSQYGWINASTQTVTPYGGGTGIPGGATGQTVIDASGATYDIGTYATDPNHEASVQNILTKMGQMTSVEQMNNYIQRVAPGSQVTGQMIANASQQYGTSWETMMAIMQQDSNFGTLGAGARSFNPGNVGNTETATSTGNLVNFGDWQSGVNAVAQNLARRRIDNQEPIIQDKVTPPAKDANKLNKELIESDSYKAVIKGQDSLQYLKQYEDLFNKVGTTSQFTSPFDNAKLKTKYNAAVLNLKEFFNLGVLNGPDLEVIQGVLSNPTDQGWVTNPASKIAAKTGIQDMKVQIEQTLDARYKQLSSQYGRYDISSFNDLNRLYVEQKKILNENVRKLINENPNLSNDEIIYIINQ